MSKDVLVKKPAAIMSLSHCSVSECLCYITHFLLVNMQNMFLKLLADGTVNFEYMGSE